MESSLAPSTARGYRAAIRKWQDFCRQEGLSALPARPTDVARYMARLAKASQSYWAVKNFCAALAYEHDKGFHDRPTDLPAIKRVLAGIQRQYRQPRAPVQPMTADLLRRVVQHWLGGELAGSQGRPAPLTTWRTVWRMAIEFHALLRFSEVRALTSHDISFHRGSSGHYMKILVRRSKTDQQGEGQEVFVHERPEWVLCCPVLLTRRYLGRLGYGVSGLKGNMQPRVQGASGRQRPQADSHICHSNAIAELRQILAPLQEGAEHFGEHSGRRGGATSALANGASSEAIMQHGRWTSAHSMHQYIEMSQQDRVQFSCILH